MVDPSLAPAPFACTALRIRKAARRVTQIYDRHVEPYGLTITQFGILAHLSRYDGASIGELAEHLVMDPTSLTRGLKPLERRGFVRQETDPDDRRARRLRLTPEGRAAWQRARAGWEKAQAQIRDSLGADETAALHAALDRALVRLAES